MFLTIQYCKPSKQGPYQTMYRQSPLPVVSVCVDSQPMEFSRVLLVLLQWIPWNQSDLHNEVSTQVLLSKVEFYVYGCIMMDLSVNCQILWFCRTSGTHISVRTDFTSPGCSFPPNIWGKRGLPIFCM